MKKIRSALATVWMMLLPQSWIAQNVNTEIYQQGEKTKTELTTNLSNDSLKSFIYRNFPWAVEDKARIFYSQDEYFAKLNQLEKDFRNEVKNLKLNESVFKCRKEEFDQKIDSIKNEILKNPDKYWYFTNKWKFIITNYETLIKNSFPEVDKLYFYSYGKDAFTYICAQKIEEFKNKWNIENFDEMYETERDSEKQEEYKYLVVLWILLTCIVFPLIWYHLDGGL